MMRILAPRKDEGKQEASQGNSGRLAERRRAESIMTIPAAAERPRLALHLATATDVSVEQARELLDSAPREPESADPIGAFCKQFDRLSASGDEDGARRFARGVAANEVMAEVGGIDG